MSPIAVGTWRLVLGAVLISSAPLFVVGLSRSGLAPTPIGAWRVLVGAIVLFSVAAARGVPLALPRAAVPAVVGGALAFAVDLYVWHRSIVLVGAGMATILGNTQVFWMTGFGRLIHGERFSRGFKVAVPLAFLGVVTVVGVGSEVAFTGSYLAGVGFGLATAVAYSTYMLCLRHATRLETAGVRSGLDQTMVLLGWICGLCAVILGVVAIGEGERLAPRGTAEVLGLVGVGVVPQVLGWLVIASGMRVLPASRAGLLLLLQPALATVWGAIWFGEVLTPLQILGAGLTLTAVYIGTVARRGGASVATPPIRDRSPTTAGTPP